jgi:hypothetical protein
MARCEDFPCCGHTSGECPTVTKTGRLVYRCCECGGKLPSSATSSICRRCMTAAHARFANGDDMFPDR